MSKLLKINYLQNFHRPLNPIEQKTTQHAKRRSLLSEQYPQRIIGSCCTKTTSEKRELTEGIVERILTNSTHHPHGIKVKLSSGIVGRVKEILDEEEE